MASKPWKRWLVRAILGIVAFPFLTLLILAAWNPSGTFLLVMMIYGALVSNHHPPPIADGLIGPEDWGHWDVASRKLTDGLERKFPAGTSEEELKFVLRRQGFKPPDPPPLNCVTLENARGGLICPKYNQKTTVEYDWGSAPCAQTIRVEWKVEGDGKITQVRGIYYGACL